MATITTNTPQSYYMRFSSHSAALSRSLLGLLSESYCTDVHISTGHQSQTIRAHKIILSAFSPYFKSLFSSLPNNQFPVIIIREINYDILRTIIEFCYRGEILVSRDKLEDIISAAKFLQIEGAKDFNIPKAQGHQQPHGQQHSASTASAIINANNIKMQIDLQNQQKANNYQKQSLIDRQQQSAHKTMSLLSKLVQKPPVSVSATVARPSSASSEPQPSDNSMPIISSVRHINEKELLSGEPSVVVKQEVLDDEDGDDEGEDEEELIDAAGHESGASDGPKTGEKSGMFAEFEEQSIVGNNSNNNQKNCNNNESNRQSEDSCDEPMDTSAAAMGHILAKVPPGTSVSTTVLSGDSQQRNDSLNVPTHESDEELVLEEEEEYEDEFDEEECDSTNPLDLLNVNLSETDESHPIGQSVPDTTSLHMTSATARAIAASTLASFNTIDLESEASTSQSSQSMSANQYSSPQSVTITTVGGGGTGSERRGRGRPPKYENFYTEIGGVFTAQPTTSSTPVISITTTPAQSGQQQTPSASSAHGSGSASTQMAITSTPPVITMGASTRSRRGRPPSMPEELLRSLTGRLDKAHHKCPHCPQIYYGYHAMRDHITSVHLNSGEKYICNLCNKEYTWRITLRKHLKFHHGVHPDQVQNA